ncbi:ABC-2 family transporter protein [Amycolatopsis sp. cmx-4-68]|uniref:ABC-2 family transporter protein n=1 Tax=Amycolatopsis sp. cmx-4-68 TaxID=2790938 RepID=UPI003979E094
MTLVGRLGSAIGFYGWLVPRNIAAALRSPDLAMQVCATALGQVGGLAALNALTHRSGLLGGLDLTTFLLVYGLLVATEGICSILADGTWQLRFYITNRDLDFLLLRPRSVALQVVFSRTGMHGLGNLLLGTGLVVYSLVTVDVPLSAPRLVAAAALVGCGIVLRSALYVIGNAAAFWSTAGVGVPMAVHMITELGKYPQTLYSPMIRVFTSAVMPVAFIGFYPAMLAVGRAPWSVWAPVGVLATVLVIVVAGAVFGAGIRRYSEN